MINAAFRDTATVERMVTRRVDQTARLHAALVERGLPVFTPAAGHCLVLDVADYLDCAAYRNPVTAFLAWVYAHAGVRGGMHVTGMARQFALPTLVRFAVPLFTPDARLDAATQALVSALASLDRIPDLEKVSADPGIAGIMHARYRLR